MTKATTALAEVERIAALFPVATATYEGMTLLGRVQRPVNGLQPLVIDAYGMRSFITDCCGASSTYHDSTLCCKACWYAVDPCVMGDVYEPARYGSLVPPTMDDIRVFFKSFIDGEAKKAASA